MYGYSSDEGFWANTLAGAVHDKITINNKNLVLILPGISMPPQ
jgi:hypothetical protein